MMEKGSKSEEFWNREEVVKGYLKPYEKNDSNLKVIQSLEKDKKILSLGCGGGRDIKELVKKSKKILALDLSEEMIKQSKKIVPSIKYVCDDAVVFAEKKKDKLKFDYILGLFSLLNYISKKDRKKLIDNLFEMLDEEGEMIFEVRWVDDRLTDLIKILIAPFYSFINHDCWEFGDIYSKHSGKSHHFTLRQLRKLFKGYNYNIDKTVIRIKNQNV